MYKCPQQLREEHQSQQLEDYYKARYDLDNKQYDGEEDDSGYD